MNINCKKHEGKALNVRKDNVQEKQSTKRAPIETKMDVLTSVKEKMLHTSRLYLGVGQTKTEPNCNRRQRTVRSNATVTIS